MSDEPPHAKRSLKSTSGCGVNGELRFRYLSLAAGSAAKQQSSVTLYVYRQHFRLCPLEFSSSEILAERGMRHHLAQLLSR